MPARRQRDEEAEQRRGEGERQAGRQPMGEHLRQHDDLQRQRATGAEGRGSRPPRRPGTAGRGRSGSRAAAAIHRIAGPMRARRLRSGPSANGTSVTIIRKKTSPSAPEPPTRAASLRSRAHEGGKARGHRPLALAGSRRSIRSSFAPRRQQRRVRRRDDDARPRPDASAISPARVSWAAVSSAAVGSSRSQSGRRATSSRASATRRRWPAER